MNTTFTVDKNDASQETSDSEGNESDATIINEENREECSPKNDATQINITAHRQNQEVPRNDINNLMELCRDCSVVLTRCDPDNMTISKHISEDETSSESDTDETSKKRVKKVIRKRKSINKRTEMRPRRLARPKSGSLKEKTLKRKLRRS